MKDKETFYNQAFFKVVEYCKDNELFLGEGTPNADILIIGKECGLSDKKRKSLKAFTENSSEASPEEIRIWIEKNSQEEANSNIERLSNNYQSKGLPNLKADINSHPTWRSYHKLVSLIRGVNKDEITNGGKNDWGFLDHCFITEISQLQLPNSNYLKDNKLSDEIRKKSIEKEPSYFSNHFLENFR